MMSWRIAMISLAMVYLGVTSIGVAAAQDDGTGHKQTESHVAELETVAPAAQDDGTGHCSLFYFDPYCSPSGWVSFALGEVVIAIILAVMLFHLGHKSNLRIDATTRKIEEILKREKESKKRRVTFACLSLKEELGIILLSVGLIHMKLKTAKSGADISAQMHEQMDALGRAINNAHDIVGTGADLLDPKLVEDMYRFLNRLEANNPIKGAGTGFPEYDNIKNSIHGFTGQLNAAVMAVTE